MDFIAIGRIAKPIGTRGEVKISPLTHDTQRFVNLAAVWLGHNTAHTELKKILNVRIERKQVVLKFQGSETVEEAKSLKDCYLFVPKEDAIQLQHGSFFIDDVIGCEVVTEERYLWD